MKREEKKQKLYFVQMNSDLFRDPRMKRLEMTGGSDAVLLYLKVWCLALESGGVLELQFPDMPPAEEISMRLDGSPAVPMVSMVLTLCQGYGLITTEGDKYVNFSLTEKYTRAWTKEAIEKRAKQSQQAALPGPAEIEAEAPEEPESEKKKKEKKEKEKAEKKSADDLLEKLWAAYVPYHKDDKKRVKAARRKELLELGDETCMRALEAYKRSDAVARGYVQNASNFFNFGINNYMNGGPAQAAPRTGTGCRPTCSNSEYSSEDMREHVSRRLEEDGVLYYDGVREERWEQVKDKYSEEEQKTARELIFETQFCSN